MNTRYTQFALGFLIAMAPTAVAQQAPVAQSNPTIQQQPSATVPAEAQTLHILAGRSVIVNTQARLKRILVSNPAIVETTTVSPTQVVVSAKAPGTASLVLWDENGRARILDVSSNVDVSALRNALLEAFPNDDIRAEADQGRIVLSGAVRSKAEADDAVKIASSYAKDVVNSLSIPAPARPKQVMLKVRFAEVDRGKLNSWAFNLFSTGAANTIGATSTQQFGPPLLGSSGGALPGQSGGASQSGLGVNDLLNIFIFRPDINLGATIKLLESKNVLQILAEPNLMARSGEPAKFLAGGEFPFPVAQGGIGGQAIVTLQFRPFGVRLDFTGIVNDDNTIRLKVAPEVSTLDYANAVNLQGTTVPAIATRRAETDIDLKNGQSFGIAGLMDRRTVATLSKMPGFGDIPILGQLFRSHNINRSNTELMVIVTPEIVDPITNPGPAPVEPIGPMETGLDLKKFDNSIEKKPVTNQK